MPALTSDLLAKIGEFANDRNTQVFLNVPGKHLIEFRGKDVEEATSSFCQVTEDLTKTARTLRLKSQEEDMAPECWTRLKQNFNKHSDLVNLELFFGPSRRRQCMFDTDEEDFISFGFQPPGLPHFARPQREHNVMDLQVFQGYDMKSLLIMSMNEKTLHVRGINRIDSLPFSSLHLSGAIIDPDEEGGFILSSKTIIKFNASGRMPKKIEVRSCSELVNLSLDNENEFDPIIVLKDLPKLRILKLSVHTSRFNPDDLLAFPTIEELSLMLAEDFESNNLVENDFLKQTDLAQLDQLKVLCIERNMYKSHEFEFKTLPSSLIYLDVSHDQTLVGPTTTTLTLLAELPNLRGINIQSCSENTLIALKQIQGLEFISMFYHEACKDIIQRQGTEILRSWPHLKAFKFGFMERTEQQKRLYKDDNDWYKMYNFELFQSLEF